MASRPQPRCNGLEEVGAIRMGTTIRPLMTTPVVTARPQTPLKELIARLRGARVSAVPVINDAGAVLGVVSEGDLLAASAAPARRPRLLAGRRGRARPAAITAGGLMSAPAVTVRAGATAQEAAHLMYRHQVKSLPVVDACGRLIGIICRGDVLSTFTRPDSAIAREIVQDVVWRSFLLNPQAFTVTVLDGIVTLAGHPETDPVGHHLIDAVRDVEGVIAVRDHLSYTWQRHPRALPPPRGHLAW